MMKYSFIMASSVKYYFTNNIAPHAGLFFFQNTGLWTRSAAASSAGGLAGVMTTVRLAG